MAPPHPALFTISPERPFLGDFADAILNGDLPRAAGSAPGPLDLADTTVYLPTRRACAGLRAALLARAPGGALLLPNIHPLGAIDADAPPEADPDHPDLPPAVPDMDRWLTLTALVQRWSRPAADSPDETGYPAISAAAAGELAVELMGLLDTAQLEGVDLAGLDELVPEEMAEHWRRTSRFLSIVTEQWPAHLRERGLLDPVVRRNRVLARAAAQMAQNPDAPVIVAGSTGSVPATAALMQTVMNLPRGAIVLPGLDQRLDAASWAALEEAPHHPQAGLARLLGALGVAREDVGVLTGDDGSGRSVLVCEVMRPAETAERWPAFLQRADPVKMAAALDGVSLVEAPDQRVEAEAIALMMRESVETPGRTAALVTPDRTLARRVAAALQTWGLDVADSAGAPLATTSIGRFMELIARVAVEADAVTLLALLKHPYVGLGWSAGQFSTRVAELEVIALRQPWFAGGLDGLEAALARAGEACAGARDLAIRLVEAFAPLRSFVDQVDAQPQDLAAAHRAVAQALAAGPDTQEIWAGPDGEAMARLCDDLISGEKGGLAPNIAPADYPGFFTGLVRREAVHDDGTGHPRLFIWGPLEARLQSVDRLILGGLNEGVWPRTAQSGPWLNRAMRSALGLPEPEWQTGLSAHDFAQGLAAPEVVLTRALKADGTPSVPSRWVSRLRLLADAVGLGEALQPAQPWLAWAAARNAPAKTRETPCPPAPRPPVAARPRALSVSDVERWIANPYALYASHILRLEQMPGLAEGPDERHRGQIIHAALSRFAERFPVALPDDPAGELIAIADDLMAEWGAFAHMRAFWRPRLARFAEWFAQTEPDRRADLRRTLSEVPGQLILECPGGAFTLTARADRIDIRADGLAIYDYKTGSISARRVAAERLQSPQLPLEGLIARSGGFDGAGITGAAPALAALAYISAAGGREAGEAQALKDPDTLAEAARDKLDALIARYDHPNTPYTAMWRPAFKALWDYDPYAHLARVAEWHGGDGA